jgi:hypothetical protein
MKFQVGDKVRVIGNDINTVSDTGLRRGMDGVVKQIEKTPFDGFPYLVKYPCGIIWTSEHCIKRIKS